MAPPTPMMSPRELRAVLWLALLTALRFSGIFLALPLLSIHAASLNGGDNLTLVGIAVGGYGLTQSFFHLPFGMASDRFGRKPTIVVGLALAVIGSLVCAFADHIAVLIIGRGIQGTGAVASAITALIADSTHEDHRTVAMAINGSAIGFTFALSLIAAPTLYTTFGMQGVFLLTGLFALLGMAIVLWGVPTPPPATSTANARHAGPTDCFGKLFPLHYGVFVLHAVQLVLFIVLPAWLVNRLDIPIGDHWRIYLPVVLLSFVVMATTFYLGRRYQKMRFVFLSAILSLICVEFLLSTQPNGLVHLASLLLLFFSGFNVLEASLPSLLSKQVPPHLRGAAFGIYSTLQSLGLFFGGLLGGWGVLHWGEPAVLLSCGLLTLFWFILSLHYSEKS